MKSHRIGILLFVLGALALPVSVRAAEENNPAVPVTVAQAVQQDVPIEVNAIGTAEAFSIITIKPQISGMLIEKLFTAGQYVTQGQVLYKIDPRPFEATLRGAEADLARQQALLANANNEADRKKELLAQHAASQWEYDQAEYLAKAQAAMVGSDEAVIQQAKLNIGYCTIVSPIDGYLGPTLTDAGNVVKANETELVVVRQVSPIYVEVAVPEQYLPQIRAAKAQGDVPMRVTIPTGESQTSNEPITGKLQFINNTVNEDSGTITLRGYFENKQAKLWPGQYIHGSVIIDRQTNAVLVPDSAVQTGQQGTFIYVMQSDQTVKSQPVTVGRHHGERVIITQGITPGQTVVIDGQLRLTPGAKVEVMKPDDAKSADDNSTAAAQESAR